MFGLGVTEIIIIVIALAVFFFGGKRVAEWARSLGRFTGEFKKGRKEIEKELKEAEKDIKEEKDELICLSCRKAYPVKDGIPIMLIEEARDL